MALRKLTWWDAFKVADDSTRPGPCFRFVGGIEVDPTGHVYLADNGNNRIRKIAPDGTASDFVRGAGTGSADVGNDAIRKVTPAGVVTTLAIEGLKPEDVAVLPDGRLVVADTGHNQVKVLPRP